MKTPNSFGKRFDYHFWASTQFVDLLTDDESLDYARSLLAHAFVADWLWLKRLQGRGTTEVELFPEARLSELQHHLQTNRANYSTFLTSADLNETVTYFSTAGEAYSDSVEDILNHVLLHGMYHRGQVAIVMRQSGTTPPSTDYIRWIRE
ncbi:MAG: DinB family protein [Rubricoccaceae bacterium]|nr:DinB family protein [Rubricoccaceae bacterium]